jgi:mono/diheme cytochrome c family protein
MLTKGLAACGFCHGEKPSPSSLLIGGREFTDRYGPVKAPNLTPSRSGLKDWSVDDIINVLRGARAPDGSYRSRSAHDGYEWMSTDDLLSIVSYLQTLPSIEHDIERRSVGFFRRNTVGFTEGARWVKGYTPTLPSSSSHAYGRYLVRHVARCNACHDGPSEIFSQGSLLSGGRPIRFGELEKDAPSIAPTPLNGIGDWSTEQIVTYLQTGADPDGKRSDPRMCPTPFYSQAAPEDLLAIATYLKQAS